MNLGEIKTESPELNERVLCLCNNHGEYDFNVLTFDRSGDYCDHEGGQYEVKGWWRLPEANNFLKTK